MKTERAVEAKGMTLEAASLPIASIQNKAKKRLKEFFQHLHRQPL